MGNRLVLPSKPVAETSYRFIDMSSLLATGEAVGSAVVTATAIIGNDPAAAIVSGSATVYMNVVKQLITGGLPGVTYCLRVAGTSNQGNVLITLADIVVLSTDPYEH